MGTKKILVVDFDQEFLRFLSQFLRNAGFSVSTAADGAAGLEQCKDENPDLIITEAMLPKLHGFELCSRITHSATRKVPVIIVTGVYKDTIYKTEALHTFGASAYFEKPLDPDDLLVSIRKILGLPAEPGKSEDDLDEAIMESLVSAPIKKRKKDLERDEIDNMLRSTLAEFGLKPGKKMASVEAPKAKPAAQEPVPATLAPKTPRLSSDANIPWILPAVKAKVPSAPVPPMPSPTSEEKKSVVQNRPKTAAVDVPASTPLAAFGEFLEKKKRPFFPKIFGAVAGVLILTSAIVYVLKPAKSRSLGQESVPPAMDELSLKTAASPDLRQQAAGQADKRAEGKRPGKTPILAEETQRPAANKPVEAPPPAVEDIKPLVLNSDSLLQLQVPDSAGTDAAREAASGLATPAGDTPASQGQDLLQGGSADPPEAQEVKLKAGDLVPLGDVDVPPQVLKTAEPIYPPAALSMRMEGSVTVNALVSETGDVIQTVVVRGIKGALGLDKSAEAAVRRWKFSPAEKGGVKVRVWRLITVTFRLRS
jgi:TonB family protein